MAVKAVDQAQLLGDRYEFRRCDRPEFLVFPAGQGFKCDDLVSPQVDNGLEDQRQILLDARCLKRALNLQSPKSRSLHSVFEYN